MSLCESGMVLPFNGTVLNNNVNATDVTTLFSPNSKRPAMVTERHAMTQVESTEPTERDIDQLLVERVQAGDKQAFNVLVRKYQYRIIKLVSRFVRNSDEVQDITQEAFIKAYRAIGGFRGDAAFYTWLYRIAINTAKNYLVSNDRKMLDQALDADDAEQFESGDWLREFATPERELMASELKQVIFSTISKLPAELKEAITLREMENLSYEEIAQVMDCPIGTVRSRIFRAREVIDNEIRPLLDRG
jgi:RNA polymerase sigma-70 factor, ECF subfamily